MNQQQESRRAAAQAFVESLEQLQQRLEAVDDQSPDSQTSQNKSAATSEEFNLNAWEEAIADIDQFIHNQNDIGDKTLG